MLANPVLSVHVKVERTAKSKDELKYFHNCEA